MHHYNQSTYQKNPCDAPGCEKRGRGRYCPMHQNRLHKHGTLEPYEPGQRYAWTVCQADGCEEQVSKRRKYCSSHRHLLTYLAERSCTAPGCDSDRVIARGYCPKHYAKFRKYGTPAPLTFVAPAKLCAFWDCGRSAGRHDYCKAHMRQLRSTGEVWSLLEQECIHCGASLPAKGGRRPTYCQQCRQFLSAIKHGISADTYKERAAEQGWKCAICASTSPGGKGNLHVDHDHGCCPGSYSCGKCMRGLLCHLCNTGLGLMRDNPSILRAAAEYLEQYAKAKAS
jgi:hypothetical protein